MFDSIVTMFEGLKSVLDAIDKHLPAPQEWSEARSEAFKKEWLGED